MAKNTVLLRVLLAFAFLFCVYPHSGTLSSRGVNRTADTAQLHFNRYTTIPQARPPDSLEDKRLLLRKIYLAEVGVRELKGQNDGPRIERYLNYAGAGRGDPWCAAFVSWVYAQAGFKSPRTAWAPALFPAPRVIWKRGKGRAVPKAGDVFGIWFQDKQRIAHAGLVDQWEEKYLLTVEGNTNPRGGREGDGVYRRRRWKKGVEVVGRWAE